MAIFRILSWHVRNAVCVFCVCREIGWRAHAERDRAVAMVCTSSKGFNPVVYQERTWSSTWYGCYNRCRQAILSWHPRNAVCVCSGTGWRAHAERDRAVAMACTSRTGLDPVVCHGRRWSSARFGRYSRCRQAIFRISTQRAPPGAALKRIPKLNNKKTPFTSYLFPTWKEACAPCVWPAFAL